MAGCGFDPTTRDISLKILFADGGAEIFEVVVVMLITCKLVVAATAFSATVDRAACHVPSSVVSLAIFSISTPPTTTGREICR